MTIDLNSELATKLKKARAGLYQARHLPGEIYTSPEIFRHEIDTIFMKEWQCVGREEEYPNPGDYLAFRIAGEPALLARDNEGKLRAFRNVCLHRGVEVATGRGNSKSFSCPYHAWTYDLTGRLMGAPMSQEVSGFDPRSCRLPAMKVDSWGGYIFVNFDPDAKDLADCLDEDGVRDFTAFLHPELTRVSDKFVFEVPCNWKFVPENLMDIYHVGVIHRDSFGGHFPVNDFRFRLQQHGYNAFYESFTMAPNGVTLFGTLPWLRGKVTDKFACTTFIRPTMCFFGRHDLIQPWVAVPLAVDRTQITIYTQLPVAYFDEPGFAEKNKIYADFIRLAASEDEAMLGSLQNGVGSRAFVPGPTVKLERAIHHLLNYYLDKLIGPDPEAHQRRINEANAEIAAAIARNEPAVDGGYSKSFQAAE